AVTERASPTISAMPPSFLRTAVAAVPVLLFVGLLATCADDPVRTGRAGIVAEVGEVSEMRLDVMKSAYCKDCHPAEYAEHEQSTHGRAFTDEEVRLAT